MFLQNKQKKKEFAFLSLLKKKTQLKNKNIYKTIKNTIIFFYDLFVEPRNVFYKL